MIDRKADLGDKYKIDCIYASKAGTCYFAKPRRKRCVLVDSFVVDCKHRIRCNELETCVTELRKKGATA